MRTAYILLLCVLGAAMLSTVTCSTSGTEPDNCCFSFYPRRIKKDLVVRYYMTDNRCTKSGVVFVTQKSRKICADPSLSWVEGIMKNIDENSF
ncbi:C-C motif chemokine 3-like [Amphiprion ocellaris]|uniref:C-C motif chemokine n=1 Tax=Amphiprion ocellaris TaxID=80972 RepID=A0A3Q1BVE4_AMPOC|nr:C-C motif chemokine 3-like [Amphiprion ocellaris]